MLQLCPDWWDYDGLGRTWHETCALQLTNTNRVLIPSWGFCAAVHKFQNDSVFLRLWVLQCRWALWSVWALPGTGWWKSGTSVSAGCLLCSAESFQGPSVPLQPCKRWVDLQSWSANTSSFEMCPTSVGKRDEVTLCALQVLKDIKSPTKCKSSCRWSSHFYLSNCMNFWRLILGAWSISWERQMQLVVVKCCSRNSLIWELSCTCLQLSQWHLPSHSSEPTDLTHKSSVILVSLPLYVYSPHFLACSVLLCCSPLGILL